MSHLPAPRTEYERGLLARAAGWPGCGDVADLTAAVLQEIATQHGIDFAAALLYDRVHRSPQHADFIRRLEACPETHPSRRLDATVVIVPGAFYVEYPHTGADGRLLREEAAHFGCPSELIPLPSLGHLSETAALICEWLAARPAGPVILVSLSKGGADVKAALARPDAACAFRNVIVWVNLCGLLEGTPLANWVLASRLRTLWFRLLLYWRGYDFTVIHDLVRAPGAPLDFDLTLPDHVQMMSVVGFPLAQHMTNRLARRCFRRVQALGPNDGAGIVLADACRLPGLLYPVWGADHYMRPAGTDIRGIIRRILHYLSEELAVPTFLPVGAAEVP
jgi:hypothetical protein